MTTLIEDLEECLRLYMQLENSSLMKWIEAKYEEWEEEEETQS